MPLRLLAPTSQYAHAVGTTTSSSGMIGTATNGLHQSACTTCPRAGVTGGVNHCSTGTGSPARTICRSRNAIVTSVISTTWMASQFRNMIAPPTSRSPEPFGDR